MVIILSCALAVFLILGIIALFKTIKILDTMQRIADKAERLAESAEAVGEFFKKTSGTLAIGRFFTNMTDFVKRKSKEEKSRG